MRLYIAEKPSLGRAIADVLPKPHKKGEGCIYVGNGDCVSWCIGHLLEQAEPDAYDSDFKKWRFEHLPIVPRQWQLKPKPESKKQLSVLRKLVKQADDLVHAGDPDREGQLLVDQVIEYLKVSPAKRKAIQRCLINDLNPPAVKRALTELRPNTEFIPLSVSALARSRADWLYGINMTRAFTLAGRKVGYDGVLSVGRVQTPLLGLVVKRDYEIDNFSSKPFYQVIAHIETTGSKNQPKSEFKAKWLPSEACQAYQDEEGRVLSKALAEKVVATVSGKPAEVVALSRKNKKQLAPLPYNLSALQIDAAKAFGKSAKQVLDICQQLYERHKLITYPRSDNRYLPAQHFNQAGEVLAAIGNNTDDLNEALANVDRQIKSKAWNDSKVDAHHAIIPTVKQIKPSSLSMEERQVYELIARQYIVQFYPPYEYCESEIRLLIEGGCFVAKSKECIQVAWKAVFQRKQTTIKNLSDNELNKNDATLNNSLPDVKKGEVLLCAQAELIEKKTTPPKPFDDASLLAAMTGIARYVDNKELRRILKETDGLGTEATRAGIIELLFKREFLYRSGKHIHASATGKCLIDTLPNMATLPDITARWETQLNDISQRQINYQNFMEPMVNTLNNLVLESDIVRLSGLRGLKAKVKPFKKRRSSYSSKTSHSRKIKKAT